MPKMDDDYLARIIELAKFETVMKLLKVAGLDWGESDSDSGLTLRDILRILVMNGCPVEAILATLKEVGEKLKEEGGDDE